VVYHMNGLSICKYIEASTPVNSSLSILYQNNKVKNYQQVKEYELEQLKCQQTYKQERTCKATFMTLVTLTGIQTTTLRRLTARRDGPKDGESARWPYSSCCPSPHPS
jgi:hypothetical protein